MLNENEKKRVFSLVQCGFSYPEIAMKIEISRSLIGSRELVEEIKACMKEEE